MKVRKKKTTTDHYHQQPKLHTKSHLSIQQHETCYHNLPFASISLGLNVKKKKRLIIIVGSLSYAQAFQRHEMCCHSLLFTSVSLGYISLILLLSVHIAVYTTTHQISCSSSNICSSKSSSPIHSITSSTMSSVKKAAKTTKSVPKPLKHAIKEVSETAVRPSKKA